MLRRDLCHRRPSGARFPREKSGGFSILELLVVIFVLGITAAIGIPSALSQLGKLRLESTATDVANLMRQTRLRAIRDNTDYTVAISGNEIVGMGAYGNDPIQLEPEDPVSIYNLGDGAAVCLNKYDGGGVFDAAGVVYQGTGVATGTGAICIHDGKGNILQIALLFATTQPKIRKYLPAAASPTGSEGFFEKTGFNVATGTGNVWVWY